MFWVQKNPLSLTSFPYCDGLFYLQVKVGGAWWVAKLAPTSHGTSPFQSLSKRTILFPLVTWLNCSHTDCDHILSRLEAGAQNLCIGRVHRPGR